MRRRGWREASSAGLAVCGVVLLAACTSNPSAGDGAPAPATTTVEPSPTLDGWNDLPVATLDGGRFAFGLDGDIWVMDGDGSHRRRLTRGAGTDFDPSWSPDGGWILFRTDRGHYRPDPQGVGVEGLFLIRADGTDEHQIYPPSAAFYGALFADWSPDGRRILFCSRWTGAWNTWVMDANGSNQRQLTTGDDQYPGGWSPG